VELYECPIQPIAIVRERQKRNGERKDGKGILSTNVFQQMFSNCCLLAILHVIAKL